MGNVAILKWAKESGCIWNDFAFSEAAKYGQLEVLKWRENQCPETESSLYVVAEAGQLEILQ